MDGDKYDCRHCRWGRHCDSDGAWPDSRGPASYPIWILPDIEMESRTCPLPMVTDWSRLMVRLWGHYKQHVLPFSGGLMDQPASFMEAMEIIEGANNRITQEKLESGRDRIARRHNRRG